MKTLIKKNVISKNKIIVIMALTFVFTITGCKNIGTIDGKTGSPVTEIDNDDSITKDGEDSDSGSKNEGLSSIIYDKEDIIMKAENQIYSNKVEEITLTIENNSSYEYYYGEEFSLEQEIDGEWVLVSPKEEIFVITIAHILESNGKNTFVSPLGYYDELSDGHYRIVKSLVKSDTNEEEATDQTEKLLLAAEFSIGAEVEVESPRLAAVYVAIEKDMYSNEDKVIKYTIVNNTDETKNVVLAPRLEKEVVGGWEAVKCEAGFCGTPDSFDEKIEGEINLEWYPSISDGVYRLSFDMEENGRETTLISDIFSFAKGSSTPSVTREEPTLNELDDTVNLTPTNYQTVNNFDGVTMSVKKESLTSNGLTIMFQNKSDNKCLYGEEFMLEKKIGGLWYGVPIAIYGGYGFDAIGYEVPSGQDSEWEVDWKWLYGSLNAGEYRIVKEVSDYRKTRDYNRYYLTAEFTLVNE